ncbi:sigma factor-like helix-turn-helix DNA-binding protein [Streptomyces sp. JNUCC 64]
MNDRTAIDVFEEHRPVLTGVAYRLLGRVVEAGDVVQDTWLWWAAPDREAVRDPRGDLLRTTTRLAVDRLRARREPVDGPWLPEPLATDYGTASEGADAGRAALADSVSFPVLVALGALPPLERAVFVLREAFGFPDPEVARALDRAEPAVRRLAARARDHVREHAPRHHADPAEHRALTERFLAAAVAGDLTRLLSLLTPDASLLCDGDGERTGKRDGEAPSRVIEGAEDVARFLHGAVRESVDAAMTFELRELNGATAVLVRNGGAPDTVLQLEAVAGRVPRVYVVRDPDKLLPLG